MKAEFVGKNIRHKKRAAKAALLGIFLGLGLGLGLGPSDELPHKPRHENQRAKTECCH